MVHGITIRHERLRDIDARENLLDAAFGEARFTKSSQRLRDGRLPADGLSFVACDGARVIGTVRLWSVSCGGRDALLLGPMAVADDCRSCGIGAKLIGRALREARRRGHGAVVLVGDAAYYGRFGFSNAKTQDLRMPGTPEPERLLAIQLAPGALDGARGAIVATGTNVPEIALPAAKPLRRAA
ncbi:MAG: GNAT family N-acetyltransferase [Pseudolabrys sp.]